jgi:hypothetical protein
VVIPIPYKITFIDATTLMKSRRTFYCLAVTAMLPLLFSVVMATGSQQPVTMLKIFFSGNILAELGPCG